MISRTSTRERRSGARRRDGDHEGRPADHGPRIGAGVRRIVDGQQEDAPRFGFGCDAPLRRTIPGGRDDQPDALEVALLETPDGPLDEAPRCESLQLRRGLGRDQSHTSSRREKRLHLALGHRARADHDHGALAELQEEREEARFATGGHGSDANRSSNAAPCASRRRADVSTASAPMSHPEKLRPSLDAAASVVPDPQKGSRTRPPSRLDARTIRSRSLRGFCVGYPVDSLRRGVFAVIAGQSVQMLPIARPSSA